MENSLVVLETSGLDGGPPQEVLIVQVQHGVVNIPHPLTIQTIDNGGVLGVLVKDIGAGVRVLSLIGLGNRHFMDTVGVLGNSRHGDRR